MVRAINEGAPTRVSGTFNTEGRTAKPRGKHRFQPQTYDRLFLGGLARGYDTVLNHKRVAAIVGLGIASVATSACVAELNPNPPPNIIIGGGGQSTPDTGTPTPTNLDIIDQVKQNPNLALLLSFPDKKTNPTAYNNWYNRVTNYIGTDMQALNGVTQDGKNLNLTLPPNAKVKFGLNEGFSINGAGSGYVLVGIDAGLVKMSDGTTAEAMLVNADNPYNPNDWYVQLISPADRAIGSEETIHGNTAQTPDMLAKNEVGQLIAIGVIIENAKGNKFPTPDTDISVAKSAETWFAHKGNTPLPKSIIPLAKISETTIKAATSVSYKVIYGFNNSSK